MLKSTPLRDYKLFKGSSFELSLNFFSKIFVANWAFKVLRFCCLHIELVATSASAEHDPGPAPRGEGIQGGPGPLIDMPGPSVSKLTILKTAAFVLNSKLWPPPDKRLGFIKKGRGHSTPMPLLPPGTLYPSHKNLCSTHEKALEN